MLIMTALACISDVMIIFISEIVFLKGCTLIQKRLYCLKIITLKIFLFSFLDIGYCLVKYNKKNMNKIKIGLGVTVNKFRNTFMGGCLDLVKII